MHRRSTFTTFLASTSLVSPSIAAYTLTDTYSPANFFTKFDFWDQKDPTNGFVQYKSLSTAASTGLIAIDNSTTTTPAIYIGVDHTTKDPSGRASVRISSKATYNHGLFIFDIEHSPGGICGTWPAFWMLSSSGKWPVGGEIDIFEGVNDERENKMTLHTTAGCSIQKTSSASPAGFSGEVDTPNCDVNAPGQGKNMGCGIKHPARDVNNKQQEMFGQGMNPSGGGVWATSWTSSDISIYHFPRSAVPMDISTDSPDPSTWGVPIAKFAGSACNIDEYFKDLNIIFNIAFCGDWAGAAWKESPGCMKKAASCEDYVRDNPAAFKDAYWMIRSVKVYQDGDQKAKRSWAWKRFSDALGAGDSVQGSLNVVHAWKRGVEILEKRGVME
ncbi:MAG: hypothetical protein Q9168_005084, partial [Polycauliona sp. 1 TL-2023]